MIVLGIDQSFSSTGYCVFSEDKTLITFGKINTSKTDGNSFERARIIVDKLKEIVDNNKVDKVCIEGLAFGGAGNATRDLAGLQFLIVDSLRPISVEIIAPTAVKKLAVGKHKGKVEKKLLFEALPKLTQKSFLDFGLKITKGLYDVTDSYWIGMSAFKD